MMSTISVRSSLLHPGYYSGMPKTAKTNQKNERTVVGERIWRLYTAAKFDRKSFAKAIEISVPSLWEIEYGKSAYPKVTTAIKMAEVLKTNVEYLIYQTGPKHRVLEKYPPDVIDLASLLAQIRPEDRTVVRAMVEQMAEVAKGQRIAAKRRENA
jgi:transcriptional regulator with XRE-family HTH domain